jgi:serine O-acetyltransferase
MLSFIKQDTMRYREQPDESLIVTFIKALYNHPSFAGILWYRLSHAAWLRKRNPLFGIILIVMRALYPLVRIFTGLELAHTADIGPGLWIGHFGPTLIHPNTKAGRNMTIVQGTTIGVGSSGHPSFGDDVSIGAGATIFGGIRIGNHVIIGAGAVVTKDVPDNSKAIGIPAQVIPFE